MSYTREDTAEAISAAITSACRSGAIGRYDTIRTTGDHGVAEIISVEVSGRIYAVLITEGRWRAFGRDGHEVDPSSSAGRAIARRLDARAAA